MNLKSTAFALPLVTMASLASAQNVEYLSYGALYQDAEDSDVFGLGGTIDYRNSNFVLNGGISYIDVDGDVDVTTLDFRAGYFVTPNAALYAGYSYLESDFLGFNADLDSYNIGGEYAFNQFTVGLNFEDFDVSGLDTFSSIYGSYQVSDAFEVGLIITDEDSDTRTVLTADYDLGDTELFAAYDTTDDFDIFSVSGNYDFQNGFRAGGSYSNFDGDGDYIAVSGGYEVAESLWIDLSVGNLDLDLGDDLDIIGLSISFETGRETLLIDRLDTVQQEAFGSGGPALSAITGGTIGGF